MGIIFMIVAGAVVGWLTAVILRVESGARHVRLLIVGGIGGALVAGALIAPALGAGDLLARPYKALAIVLSLIGGLAAAIPIGLFLRNRSQ